MTTTDATIETDLLPRLRRSTGPLHDDIEALLRLEAPMPLVRYGRILRGFHEFLQLWEPRARQALPERLRPWFDARVRSPFAARDLAALELPEDAADTAMRASALAALHGLRLDSPAAALGSLYVIEGSALGGQVLTPKLLAAHGLTPEHGAAYFHGFRGPDRRDVARVPPARPGRSRRRGRRSHRRLPRGGGDLRALIATFGALDAPATPAAPAAPPRS